MSTPDNSLMTQAAGMFSNPNAAAVPPAPQGVIDPTQHPVIKAIIQALSQGAQGFSQTAMDPRERMQRQEMDAQKAEAMSRLGMQQQQLSYEGQRVGFEGQRTASDVARSSAQQKQAEAETAAIPVRTATEQKRTAIEQQRADQEHQDRLAEHDQRSKQLEEEVRSHGAQEKLGAGKLGVEQKANQLAGERIDMEKKHFEDGIAMQGKQYTRQLAEDERKQLHSALDGYYKEHPILADITGTGPQTIQQKHKDIDDYIDKKIGVQTGSSVPAWDPRKGVMSAPMPGQDSQSKPAYKGADGKWYDAGSNKPI